MGHVALGVRESDANDAMEVAGRGRVADLHPDRGTMRAKVSSSRVAPRVVLRQRRRGLRRIGGAIRGMVVIDVDEEHSRRGAEMRRTQGRVSEMRPSGGHGNGWGSTRRPCGLSESGRIADRHRGTGPS